MGAVAWPGWYKATWLPAIHLTAQKLLQTIPGWPSSHEEAHLEIFNHPRHTAHVSGMIDVRDDWGEGRPRNETCHFHWLPQNGYFLHSAGLHLQAKVCTIQKIVVVASKGLRLEKGSSGGGQWGEPPGKGVAQLQSSQNSRPLGLPTSRQHLEIFVITTDHLMSKIPKPLEKLAALECGPYGIIPC